MSIFYNIFSLYILFISIILFTKASGSLSLTRINTVSFVFYKDLLPVAFIGVLLVANNLVDNHYIIRIIEDDIKIKGWIFSLYSLILMPISMIFVNKLFHINPKKQFRSYLEKEIKEEINYENLKFFSILLTLISFLTLTYILYNSPAIPLLTALKGNFLEASIERREVKVNFNGIVYIKNMLGLYFMPIITYYFYIYKLKYNTIFYKVIYYINFLLTTILLVYDTQKAPLLYFLLGFLIIETLVKGKLSTIKLIIYSLVMVVSIVTLYIVNTGIKLEHLLRFDNVIVYRLFVGQISGYFLSLQWFPDLIRENTAFVGIPSFLLKMFDFPNIESARLLMMYFNPTGVREGNADLMNSYFLGEAWANYGYIGLFFSPIIVGTVIQIVHIWLIKSDKKPINMAFYTGITIKWVVTGGIVGFLYLKVLIVPFIMYVFCNILLNLFRRS